MGALLRLVVLLAAAAALAACGGEDTAAPPVEAPPANGEVEPDVGYVPTPQPVVERMLEMAAVGSDDVVYDLGSGDGRIPITAARDRDAEGLGVEIQPELVELSRENARAAGVDDRVEFVEGDLFELDLSPATVVTLYLLQELNLELRPKLLEELEPGSRIVSNTFDMGEWGPEQTETVDAEGRTWTLYAWTVPDEIPAELQE